MQLFPPEPSSDQPMGSRIDIDTLLKGMSRPMTDPDASPVASWPNWHGPTARPLLFSPGNIHRQLPITGKTSIPREYLLRLRWKVLVAAPHRACSAAAEIG